MWNEPILPRNLTWNLKVMVSKKESPFPPGLLFRFHVKFQGCIYSTYSGHRKLGQTARFFGIYETNTHIYINHCLPKMGTLKRFFWASLWASKNNMNCYKKNSWVQDTWIYHHHITGYPYAKSCETFALSYDLQIQQASLSWLRSHVPNLKFVFKDSISNNLMYIQVTFMLYIIYIIDGWIIIHIDNLEWIYIYIHIYIYICPLCIPSGSPIQLHRLTLCNFKSFTFWWDCWDIPNHFEQHILPKNHANFMRFVSICWFRPIVFNDWFCAQTKSGGVTTKLSWAFEFAACVPAAPREFGSSFGVLSGGRTPRRFS